jgi:hypothetical protein
VRIPGVKWVPVVVLGTLVGISSVLAAPAPKAKVNGQWTLTLGAGDLNPANTGGANFPSTFSSLVSGSGGPITVEIQIGTPPLWVSISRTTAGWAPGVSLIARIAPPVPAWILTNNSPVPVTDGLADFYRTNSTSALTIYYELSGVSVDNLTPTTYSTTVTFTAHY